MAARSLKSRIRKTLAHLGVDIKLRKNTCGRAPSESLEDCLRAAARNGLRPRTVLDIGVATGTEALYETFPEAKHILVEPLAENTEALESIVRRLQDAEYVLAAATSTPKDVAIHVHKDLVGSTLYREDEGSDLNDVTRTVPGLTIDTICAERNAQGPFLIKLDTQGAELEALRGAEETLADTDFVAMETSLFQFFKGGPQLYDCVAFMKERGFVVYDVFGASCRPLDGALAQIDLAFVRENGPFRKYHSYATPEQRHTMDALFAKNRGENPKDSAPVGPHTEDKP